MRPKRLRDRSLRDRSMDCIFPPHYKHDEFVSARTCGRTSALASERKEDQILRTETVRGAETGGEWMAVAHRGEPDSGMVATASIGARACTKIIAGRFASTSAELLMAGVRSGAVVV